MQNRRTARYFGRRLDINRFHKSYVVNSQACSLHQQFTDNTFVNQVCNAFKIRLNIHNFTPDEIKIRILDSNTIQVEGKHEEKPDKYGSVFRHFIRKYKVPNGVDVGKLKASISVDEILSIASMENDSGDTEVPIEKSETFNLVESNSTEENQIENLMKKDSDESQENS